MNSKQGYPGPIKKPPSRTSRLIGIKPDGIWGRRVRRGDCSTGPIAKLVQRQRKILHRQLNTMYWRYS